MRIKSSYAKWFLTKVKKAIAEYQMINPGERVLVGLSGGKDSTALLYILALLRDRSHLDFELHAMLIDPGWAFVDTERHRLLCERLEVPLEIMTHPIAKIITKRGELNACTICSKLRNGILNSYALKIKANSVALGHHLDDAIETWLLNLMFTGQMKTFLPNTYLSNTRLKLIRPMAYLPEKVSRSLVEDAGLPVMDNHCPFNGSTRRDEVKALVENLVQRYPDFREKFLSGLHNVDMENLWRQK